MTYFMQDNYSVYDSLPCSVAVFMINDNLDVIYSNTVYNEMFGKKYIGICGDDERRVFDEIVSQADTPRSVFFKSKDSHGKKIAVRAFVIKISEEKAFGLFIDDSENVETIKKLDTRCARYAAAISGTDEIFFEYSKGTDTLTIFFSSPDGIIMRDINSFLTNLHDNEFIPDEDKEHILKIVKNHVAVEKRFDIHMRLRRTEDYEWYKIMLKPDKREGIFVGSARNINDAKNEEDRLKEKALIDPLSKVFNRAAAIERIQKRLKKRSPDKECALIVLDIDNFKKINDTFGHLYGDAVIAMAAGSIKSTLDKEDIIGRFGGDEFFVFIDNTEKASLEKKLDDIRLSILKMRLDQNDENDISCSIGVTLGAGGSVYEEMFKKADSALYSAKKNGKNRFEYFSGEYCDEGALSYAGNNDEDESNEAHNVTAVALEIASKSTNAENAISNIMRHIGMALELDVIQIFKYDTVEDKVYIEFQWWRENGGAYNIVYTDKKMGYYNHNDLVIFKNRFAKDKIFQYTPDFKEGFSKKFRDVFEQSEDINSVYASNTENESVFYAVCYQSQRLDRVWTDEEMNDMMEIAKILSMYLKSAYVMTDREKMLMQCIDYDWTGLFTMQKFYDEAGKITRVAAEKDEIVGLLHIDIQNLYAINTIYGRDVGDHIVDSLIDFLEKFDSEKSIACHINGTDNFIVMFRTPKKDGVVEMIEEKTTEICEKFSEYKNPPVIIKSGLTFFKPGAYIVDHIDVAKNIKKGVEFDRCRCIVADEVPTQYKRKNQYRSPDRRKQKQ